MATNHVSSVDVQAQLERMLDSETFRGAERSRSLLRFVVQEALEGRADRLKDYVLGAEALGRGERFDPRTDPIARVEASRLRSRLDVYYATEGAADAVRISLPKGGYAPAFERRTAPPPQPVQPAPHGYATYTPTPMPRRSISSPPVGVSVAIALAAGVCGWLLGRGADQVASPETRTQIVTPPTTDSASLAVSPDGRSIVFVASTEGRSRLWIRRLDSDTPHQLVGTEFATLPFWAPDGRSLGFFADGKIKRIDLETGLVRVLSTALVPAGAAWSRDGVILHPLVPDSPLFRTSVAGSPLVPATQLVPGQTGHRGPIFLSDGHHFLFYAMGEPAVKGIHVGELGTTAVRRLLDADTPPVFASPNHLLYVHQSTLFAHRFDPPTITLVGDPIRLADGIDVTGGVAPITASAGTIVYRSGPSAGKRQLMWVDRLGRELSRIGTAESFRPSYASLSPDGRRVGVQRSVEGNTDIWLVDADERGTSTRLTDDPQADIAPRWSPRGDRIVYASQKDRAFQLFERAPDGTRTRLLLSTPHSKQVTDWSLDGRYLLFRTVAHTPGADIDIWALPLGGDEKPFPVRRTPFEERDAQFSPDANWIAYHSNDSGQHEVYAQPFQREGERQRISTNGGVQARWRPDGKELFYLTPDGQLVAVPIVVRSDGRSLEPGAAVPLFHAKTGPLHDLALHSYIVARDGQRFLVDRVVEEQPPPISLILNWRPPAA